MKVSELTIQEIKDYARVEHSDDDMQFEIILTACKSYVKGYTGMSDEQLDTKEDITIAVQVLANEMYENRTMTVQNDKVNKVVQSILDMHCLNLL